MQRLPLFLLYCFAAILLLAEVTTILAVLFCCYFARYKYVRIFEYLEGLLLNRLGLFMGERVVENTPTPRFEQPLKFIAHGHIFDYCTSNSQRNYTHSICIQGTIEMLRKNRDIEEMYSGWY